MRVRFPLPAQYVDLAKSTMQSRMPGFSVDRSRAQIGYSLFIN
jgi:hypothetical protein